MIKEKFDDKDLRIINLLRLNARMSYTEIGDIVGLTRTSVKKRIIDLEKSGDIAGYSILYSCKPRGSRIMYMVTVDIKPEFLEEAKEKIVAHKYNQAIFETEDSGRLTCIDCIFPNAHALEVEKNFYKMLGGVVSVDFRKITDIPKGKIAPTYPNSFGRIVYDKL